MGIAIVASRDLPVDQRVYETIESLVSAAKRDGQQVHIRAETRFLSPASLVEEAVDCIGGITDTPVVKHRAVANGGRESTFYRDYDLVQSVNRVVAFFQSGRAMEGGTGHVVHAAIVKNVPVVAYEVGETVTLIGSLEVDGARW